MPSALVVVKMKTSNGNTFSNVHAVKQVRGGTGTGQPDQAFIDDLLGPRLKVGDFSFVTGGGPIGNSLAEAILRWHTGLHSTHVTVEQLYVSDGKTPGAGTGTYAVLPVNLPCTATWHGGVQVNEGNCDALNTALMVSKQPTLLSLRAGRMWLRAAVRNTDVDDGSKDGATLVPAAAARIKQVIENAEQGSNLAAYYDGEVTANGQMYYGQAQFYSKVEVEANPSLLGALKVVQTIRGMQLADANSRQLKRGRKQKITQQQLAKELRSQGLYDAADEIEARIAATTVVNTGIYPTVVEPLPDPADVDTTGVDERELDPANYDEEGNYTEPGAILP